VVNARWGAGHAVTWSHSETRYTITGLTAGLTYTFSEAAQHVLGVNASYTGVTSIVSARRPYYVIRPVVGEVSRPSHEFEATNQSALAVSDSGIPYGTARTVSVKHKSWEVEFEPRAQTLAYFATDDIPFTWQHFIEHARTVYSICLVTQVAGSDVSGLNIGRLLPGFADFNENVRSRHVEGYDDQWRIRVEMVLVSSADTIPSELFLLTTEDGIPLVTESDSLLLWA
jgi:hypothetical protein